MPHKVDSGFFLHPCLGVQLEKLQVQKRFVSMKNDVRTQCKLPNQTCFFNSVYLIPCRSEVRFYCQTPYLLVGSISRVCQGDGIWSGQQPACIGDHNTMIPFLRFINELWVCWHQTLALCRIKALARVFFLSRLLFSLSFSFDFCLNNIVQLHVYVKRILLGCLPSNCKRERQNSSLCYFKLLRLKFHLKQHFSCYSQDCHSVQIIQLKKLFE